MDGLTAATTLGVIEHFLVIVMNSRICMYRSILTSVFLVIFLASCAGSEATATQRGLPLDNMAAYGLDQTVNVQASAFQAKDAKTKGIDLPVGNYLPTKKVAPDYPRNAMKKRQTGWVIVAYTVNESGKLEDIRIVDEYPKGLFSESALAATGQFEFSPYMSQGTPTRIPNAWNLFTYELAR